MPQPYRWMLFADGENLTLQGQKLAQQVGLTLEEGPLWYKDVFMWVPGPSPVASAFMVGYPGALHIGYRLEQRAIRAHYYTALTGGNDQTQRDIEARLRALYFDPCVFRKVSGKSKAVDIALATDMLGHAFRGNYDLAILIAGDRDYLPLIQEIKRLGRIACVYYFEGPGLGLSDELRLAADHFGPLDDFVVENWRRHLDAQARTKKA